MYMYSDVARNITFLLFLLLFSLVIRYRKNLQNNVIFLAIIIIHASHVCTSTGTYPVFENILPEINYSDAVGVLLVARVSDARVSLAHLQTDAKKKLLIHFAPLHSHRAP